MSEFGGFSVRIEPIDDWYHIALSSKRAGKYHVTFTVEEGGKLSGIALGECFASIGLCWPRDGYTVRDIGLSENCDWIDD